MVLALVRCKDSPDLRFKSSSAEGSVLECTGATLGEQGRNPKPQLRCDVTWPDNPGSLLLLPRSSFKGVPVCNHWIPRSYDDTYNKYLCIILKTYIQKSDFWTKDFSSPSQRCFL